MICKYCGRELFIEDGWFCSTKCETKFNKTINNKTNIVNSLTKIKLMDVLICSTLIGIGIVFYNFNKLLILMPICGVLLYLTAYLDRSKH